MIPRGVKLLGLLCLALGLLGCTASSHPQEPPSEHAGLLSVLSIRTDGVYQSGVKPSKDASAGKRDYIRFYPDGGFLRITTSLDLDQIVWVANPLETNDDYQPIQGFLNRTKNHYGMVFYIDLPWIASPTATPRFDRFSVYCGLSPLRDNTLHFGSDNLLTFVPVEF